MPDLFEIIAAYEDRQAAKRAASLSDSVVYVLSDEAMTAAPTFATLIRWYRLGIQDTGQPGKFSRFRAKLGQRELARLAGVTQPLVSMMESGDRLPRRPIMAQLARALKLNANQRTRLMEAAGYVAGIRRVS